MTLTRAVTVQADDLNSFADVTVLPSGNAVFVKGKISFNPGTKCVLRLPNHMNKSEYS